MIFDSHAHYNDHQFSEDREAVLASLPQNNICGVLNCGDTIESSRICVELANRYPLIYAAIGVHPESVGEMKECDLDALRAMAKDKKVVAIGEIGLDYHYDDGAAPEKQKYWFKKQIELARELNLPFVVHARDACADTIEVLSEVGYFRGVMHCFSGSRETAEILLKMGMYIGFGGTVTYKNNKKAKEVARIVPSNRYLLETDCPYLPPDGHRGKRNTSLYLPRVVEELALLRGCDMQTVEKETEENTKRLLGL